MPTSLEKRHQAAKFNEECRNIIKKADTENRSLTAEDKQQMERLDKFYDESMADAIIIEKTESRSLALSGTKPINPIEERSRPGKGKKQRLVTREDYAKLSHEKRRSTKRYNMECRQFFTHGLSKMNLTECRSLRADDDIYGGALVVPMIMSAQYIKAVDDAVYMRQICYKETIKKAMSLGIPVRTARMSDSEWTSELGTPTADTALKFGRRELTGHQLKKEILVSEKLMMNSSRNPEEIVNTELSYVNGITLEKAYISGTGVNKPLGVFTQSTTGISSSRNINGGNSSGVILDTGLLDVYYALKQQYRMSKSLAWIMHRDRIRDIRKIKDSEGRFIWSPGFDQGMEGSLFGVRTISSEFCPTSTASGAFFAVLGDFNFYTILDVQEQQIVRLDELHRRSGQIGFISTVWGDGMPTLEDAFARATFA